MTFEQALLATMKSHMASGNYQAIVRLSFKSMRAAMTEKHEKTSLLFPNSDKMTKLERDNNNHKRSRARANSARRLKTILASVDIKEQDFFKAIEQERLKNISGSIRDLKGSFDNIEPMKWGV